MLTHTRRAGLAMLAALVLAGSAAAVTRSGSSLKATLTPIPPVKGPSGTFSASVTSSGSLALMTWQLRTAHLTSASRSALIYVAKHHQPSAILCRPCAASAHGVASLSTALAKQLGSGKARVVVTTKSHRAGELRGTIHS